MEQKKNYELSQKDKAIQALATLFCLLFLIAVFLKVVIF
jgi:hypothetical protein